MSRNNLILCIAAIIQAVIIALVFWLNSRPANATIENLITVPQDNISALTITDDTGNTLSLGKEADTWVLPDADNYPADEFRVNSFLQSLTNVNPQGLIARNSSSYERLNISDNNFIRKIEVTNASGKDETLYLGSSPRASAIHARSSNGSEVYLTGDIRSSDADTNKGFWVDTSIFNIPQNDIISVQLSNESGDYTFEKVEDIWQFNELPNGETFKESSLTNILSNIANLRMLEPLSLESTDTHGTGNAAASIQLTTQTTIEATEASAETSENEATELEAVETETEEKTYTLEIGNDSEDGFAVKSSESDYVLKVSKAIVENLITHTLEDFSVQPEPEVQGE